MKELLFLTMVLLFAYQTKHLVADYFLQGEYMLGKFKERGWVKPLAAHAAVHMIFTFSLSIAFVPFYIAIILSVVDFIVHFLVDKAKVEASREYTHQTKEFWWILGVDQYLHHLTHYGIIFVILVVYFGL